MAKKIDSDDIKRLLSEKHHTDIFVPECKDGPTHTAANLYKLDAWAMARSWIHPCTTGYEIKVSRSDWLQDRKFIEYAKLVHEMYIVSPKGIVMPEELPDGIGLMWVASTGTRLFTKRRAVYRDIELPASLLVYVLMCRATIDVKDKPTRRTRDDWERALADDKDDALFGALLGGRIKERFAKRVIEVGQENKRLQSDIERLQPIADELKKRNVHCFSWARAEDIVDQLLSPVAAEVKGQIKATQESLTRMQRVIEQLGNRAEISPSRKQG